MTSLTLNNGKTIPSFALGSYAKFPGDAIKAYNAIKHALKIGIRHIDTAYVYRIEQIVGHAIADSIAEGTVSRKDVFVTTKCWPAFFTRERVVESLRRSLHMLQVGYVDLYLVHFPCAFKQGEEQWPKDESGKVIGADIDLYSETWKGMEDCVNLGLAKSIGVSNFNAQQISALLETCTIKPVANQVECHPLLAQRKLIDFCRTKGLVVQAYSPLGGNDFEEGTVKNKLLENELIDKIAKKYSKTPHQILLKFHIQRGIVVVAKSFNPESINKNYDIFDFEMTTSEIEALEALDANHRRVRFSNCESLKNYPFHNSF